MFNQEVITHQIFEHLVHEVKMGDVLLYEGHSPISAVVRKVTHSNWTHSMLYIGPIQDINDIALKAVLQEHYSGSESDPLVLEAYMGYGTVLSNLNNYAKVRMRLCRPHDLSHADALKVVKYAANHLGNAYDYRHFFDLGRFLCRIPILPRCFLSALFKKRNKDKNLCSTLIADSFFSIGFPIAPLGSEKSNYKFYTPRDFDLSPYFDIIKYSRRFEQS